jgi:hypothetical protein
VDNNVDNLLLEADVSDLKVVKNTDFARMDLCNVDLSLLIQRDDHASGRNLHKDDSRSMLGKLAEDSQQIVDFVDWQKHRTIFVGVFFLNLLLNVPVHIYVSTLGADQKVVEDEK